MKKPEQENQTMASGSEVNVEAIMDQIRQKVHQQRQKAVAQGLQAGEFISDDYPEESGEGNYDPQLYEQLRYANQPHRIIGVRQVASQSIVAKLPLIGPIWQRVQTLAHNLVIFYVNSFGAEVIDFLKHVASVLNRLVRWSQAQDKEILLLRQEVETLKEQVRLLETKQ